uniref:Expansin family protein n=1 Tax=Mycena chlorophos TaxID=658473 RepID=A0ABQ0L0L1_MYCCL|nr:predicted protein [Mycena chlorophos]
MLSGLLLLFAPLALASHGPSANHHDLAKRHNNEVHEVHDFNLTRRQSYSGARWTYYSAGLGACGQTNGDGDFIVALNQDTFGYSYPSEYCWKKIQMEYNGKSTQATIMDSCPGCPSPSGLDLTPGLFSYFADQSEGVIYGTWWFVDGDDSTTTSTHHTTTSTHTTTHTTYTPPTTTHTTTSTTTHTTSSSSKESSSSQSSSASSSAHSSSSTHATSSAPSNSVAAPSGTVAPVSNTDAENLYSAPGHLLIAGWQATPSPE